MLEIKVCNCIPELNRHFSVNEGKTDEASLSIDTLMNYVSKLRKLT